MPHTELLLPTLTSCCDFLASASSSWNKKTTCIHSTSFAYTKNIYMYQCNPVHSKVHLQPGRK